MTSLTSVKNNLFSWYKSGVEQVMSINTQSEFLEKGVLTPDEFLKAGTQLCYKCPTWAWRPADKDKNWSFLPEKQQYLITRNVPCLKRVSALQNNQQEEELENGEWLGAYTTETNNTNNTNNNTKSTSKKDDEIEDIDDIDDIPDEESNTNNTNKDNKSSTNDITNGISNFNLNIKEDYQNNITTHHKNDTNLYNDDDLDENQEDIQDIVSDSDDGFEQINNNTQETNNKNNQKNENNNNILKVNEPKKKSKILKHRSYDISITYDKYYSVPHVWLRGYNENNEPLTSKEIMEDISSDHAHKTVTIENHPHLKNTICVSIHPCRHSSVMKLFMNKMKNKITVDQYMFLFLKFMSAVIPTIEYDYTHGV